MRLLTRYVVGQLLGVFVTSLAAVTIVLILAIAAQEAIRQGLGWQPILRIIPYLMPNALQFAVPGAILFAACSVYGRMSASNELVALRSVGVSPLEMVKPALWLGFALSLFALWLNDLAVTWGRQGAERVVLESVEQIAYGMLRTQRSYSTRRFSINVKDVDGRELLQPTLLLHGAGDAPSVLLSAESAELRSNPEQNTLSIFLTNGAIEVGDKVTMVFPDTIERVIALSDAARKGEFRDDATHRPLWALGGEIDAQRRRIVELEQQLAATAALHLAAGDFAPLAGSAWSEQARPLEVAEWQLRRIRVEPWRRLAAGFSCFCFVLVGAPLAVRLRTGDFWTTFGLCYLPSLVVFFLPLAYGLDRAKSGELPPAAVWLGNVVFLVIGVWLLDRLRRQ